MIGMWFVALILLIAGLICIYIGYMEWNNKWSDGHRYKSSKRTAFAFFIGSAVLLYLFPAIIVRGYEEEDYKARCERAGGEVVLEQCYEPLVKKSL